MILNSLLNRLLNSLIRKGIFHGIDKGTDYMAKRNTPPAPNGSEERRHKPPKRDTGGQDKARQTMRLLRRFGRF